MYLAKWALFIIYLFFLSRSGKIESATVTYVQRQAVAFFAGVLETSLEFRKAFCKTNPEAATTLAGEVDEFKMSSLMVWTRDQLSK